MATLERWEKIEDIDSHKRWYCGLVTGPTDWPVHLFVTMQYTDYFDREWAKNGKYHFEIAAVAHAAVEIEETAAACRSLGMTIRDFMKLDPIYRCVALMEYGTRAVLWQRQGRNETALKKLARQELLPINTLFGFYMDKPMNAIGDCGWDFIKGTYGSKERWAAHERKEAAK